MSSIQADIEARLAVAEPDVEVLLAEVVGGGTLRLFVDHPDGVTLELCERVTHALEDLREHYALEVSSPGRKRPASRRRWPWRFLRLRRAPRPLSRESGHDAALRSASPPCLSFSS